VLSPLDTINQRLGNMPVDHQHAFANGATYPISGDQSRPLGWIWHGLARLPRFFAWLQASEAAATFANRAIVGANCRIGQHAWCANGGARSNIRLGDYVICRGILRSEQFRPGTIAIGDHAYIGDDCILSCAYQIQIGSWVMLAHGVQVFDNDSHPLQADLRQQDYWQVTQSADADRRPIPGAPIRIGSRAWIGFNALILKGVQIGEGAVVAAGSIVTHDVAPYMVVAGNPARPIKQLLNADFAASAGKPDETS
jgi:acetyltransferase-like isoleucine patch superfamily enzyme